MMPGRDSLASSAVAMDGVARRGDAQMALCSPAIKGDCAETHFETAEGR